MIPNPKPKKAVKLIGDPYNALREAVFERDNRTCQLCGATGVTMDAHHAIYPRNQYPGDVIWNMLTLCRYGCHHIIHHGPHGSKKLREKAERKMGEINGK